MTTGRINQIANRRHEYVSVDRLPKESARAIDCGLQSTLVGLHPGRLAPPPPIALSEFFQKLPRNNLFPITSKKETNNQPPLARQSLAVSPLT